MSVGIVEQPETEQPARRLRVHRGNTDPTRPWLAVIYAAHTVDAKSWGQETAVGAFATHAEAVRTGCTALTFLAAGIPWRVQS